MSSTVKLTKAATLARLQAIVAGTQKHFANASVTFGNASHTSASLIALFQSLIAARQACDVADASAKDAMATRRQVEANVDPTLRAFEHFLQVTFAGATGTLADFGLAPPKARAPLTTEKKAAAAQKRKATRALLGTKGKQQKKTVLQAAAEAQPKPPVLKA
jgi:hypothetical protein